MSIFPIDHHVEGFLFVIYNSHTSSRCKWCEPRLHLIYSQWMNDQPRHGTSPRCLCSGRLCPLTKPAWSFCHTTWQKCLLTAHIYSNLSFGVNGLSRGEVFNFSPRLCRLRCEQKLTKTLTVTTTPCFKCHSYTVAKTKKKYPQIR